MSEKTQDQGRRRFMKASVASTAVTALGVGFVAAADPVLAAAIETDFKGLKAGEQMIPVGSFQMPAGIWKLPTGIICSPALSPLKSVSIAAARTGSAAATKPTPSAVTAVLATEAFIKRLLP